jgi:phosphonoacetaldehyde hydrolase
MPSLDAATMREWEREQMPTRLSAVIFDWAGTIVDHGSRAPVAAFREVFRRRGVEVSAETARFPMGLSKRDHLAAMLAAGECASAWRRNFGRDPSAQDLDALYAEFLPIQYEILPHYAEVIPGVIDLARELRRRGLALGSTTGYSRGMLDILEPLAAKQGLCVDCIVCADQVPAGRPKPWMLFAAAEALDAYPPRALVNVDDTAAGVEAGCNAGFWTIGVARTGSELGLSLDETAALDPNELERRIDAARRKLLAAGADFVVDSAVELPAVLDAIEKRLASGRT